MTKTHVAFVRDHSGSMGSIGTAAKNDFNTQLDQLSETAIGDVDVTVVEFGVRGPGGINVPFAGIDLARTPRLQSYRAEAMTPLYDGVGKAISLLNAGRGPSQYEDGEAFLVMVTTDGGENDSRQWTASALMDKINELQLTDRWTFVWRVPRGAKSTLVSWGVPDGNIIEWDNTTRGQEAAMHQSTAGIATYMSARATGGTSTRTFYTNVAGKTESDMVASSLVDCTSDYTSVNVPSAADGTQIRDFCQKFVGEFYPGNALYQLVKPEKIVQESKTIAIRDKNTGKIYAGKTARTLLGIPVHGNVSLRPGDHGQYDVFVQSTSTNRKVVGGTEVLYWKGGR